MATLFLQYPACSTCQKAKKWLTENNIEFTNRLIVEENPTVEELKAWIPRSGLPVKKFFNTSGLVYKELKLSVLKSEQIGKTCTLKSCIHHLYMRNKITRHIKARKMYAITVTLNSVKKCSCYLLGCISINIPRKSSVYIRIICRPESLSNIHGKSVNRWDNKNLMIVRYCTMSLKLFKYLNKLRTYIQLLYLITS